MTERREPEDMGEHKWEVETLQLDDQGREAHRISCSCGFLGPLRSHKRAARQDGNNHEDRRAEGKA